MSLLLVIAGATLSGLRAGGAGDRFSWLGYFGVAFALFALFMRHETLQLLERIEIGSRYHGRAGFFQEDDMVKMDMFLVTIFLILSLAAATISPDLSITLPWGIDK